MSATKAVLFDWRGTLAVGLTEWRWVELALGRTGRGRSAPEVHSVLDNLEAAAAGEEFQEARPRLDCSTQFHRETYDHLFAAAGLDEGLGEALYEIESDAGYNPLALDAPRTLRTLVEHGVRVAVVSDIHFDIRPSFANQGLAGLIEAYALSFEVGEQKPSPILFQNALELLGVEPRSALMVGDRLEYDGGAATLGIPTLILPPLHDITDQRLDLVLRAAGCSQPEGRVSGEAPA